MGNRRVYELSGLRVSSTLPVHADAEGAPLADGDHVDFVIREGEVPAALEHPNYDGPAYQAGDDTLLLHVPGLVRCLVTGGQEIVYERSPEATDADVRVFVFGSAFGALCYQRGLFPLHASALEVDGGVIALVGKSGAGKSTLAASLAERGHRVLCDDVCVVWTDGARPEVAPGVPVLRLWRHAITSFGGTTEGFDAVREGVLKFNVPVATMDRPDRLPLRRIYSLREARGQHPPGIEHIRGLQAVNIIAANAYRRRFPRHMAFTTKLFELASTVAAGTNVARIVRPMGFEHVPATYAMLEADWATMTKEYPG